MAVSKRLSAFFLGCTSVAALASAAYGQETNETVEVSASRISIQGYQAPTPVMTVGIDKIERDAKIDLGDLIRQLPSVGTSASLSNGVGSNDASQGDAGIDTINLRNLNTSNGFRTLILFDGQRVVSSNIFGGGVDLTTLPSTIVQRIDVVTGGASAAWGSDAVAGVVNLIINKRFDGFKSNVSYSDGTAIGHRQTSMEASWGSDFDGDRGHVVLSGKYNLSPDTVFQGEAPYWNGIAVVPNPTATAANGQPLYIHAYHVGSPQYTSGGLITASTGLSTTNAAAVKGIMFTGLNAAQSIFNFGTVSGSNCYNGCTNTEQTSTGRFGVLAVPHHSGTLFGLATYKLTDDITATLQLNYGASEERNTATLKLSANSIKGDNAYLPANISQLFGTTLSNGYNTTTGQGGTAIAPTQSVTIGTQNVNNMDPTRYDLSALCHSVGQPCNTNNRVLTRAVFTLDGTLGNDWKWTAYVQHGGVRETQKVYNDPLTANYNFAVDAVTVTASNVGASGLALGSIQCRALLSAATAAAAAGCQPLDTIGNGVASQAALKYINPGEDPSSGRLNHELIVLNQDGAAATIQGTLPWDVFGAGPAAMAFGGEYRHEQAGVIQADPGGKLGAWAAGNFVPYSGQYNVEEGFVEVDQPILKDNLVQSLSFNAAGRLTNYSTSGLVETWKLGLTSQVNDDLRLRTTWSLDIRAPSITELFSPGTLAAQNCVYPPNTPSFPCFRLQGGNPNLQPEKAITVSGGIVLTPHWIDGLQVSLDWYSINIHGAIFSTNFQTILNRCYAGEPVYCSAITFVNGVPSQVLEAGLNAAVDTTSGLDFQADYTMPLFSGSMDWSLVGNYTDEQSHSFLGVTYDSAGALGSPLSYASSGIPKLRANLSATYNEDPISVTAQIRYIGSAVLTNGVQNLAAEGAGIAGFSATPGVPITGAGTGSQLDYNNVDPVAYLDLRASYKWDENIQLYAAIDNVTNVPRPNDGNNTTYDILGRVIRGGFRLNY